MRQGGPPPLATWILEHLAPGDHDEALAGDLLEAFHAGRSSSWYWRQALAACATAWLKYARSRGFLIIFAALWALLAPAWTALQDRIENGSHVFGAMLRMDWPFSTLSTIGVWLALNLSFLWIGILLYFLFHTNIAVSFRSGKIGRALTVSGTAFLPIYFGTFALMNLLSFPGPTVDRHTITLLGELTDARMWANALRIPYFLTLLCALWNTAVRREHEPVRAIEWETTEHAHESDVIALASELHEWSLKRYFGFIVGGGFVNALIAALLLCRLPSSNTPTLTALFIRASIYVFGAAVCGVAATRFYWSLASSVSSSGPPIPFRLFALATAAAWTWLPSAVLLSDQDSPATAVIAGIGATILALQRDGALL